MAYNKIHKRIQITNAILAIWGLMFVGLSFMLPNGSSPVGQELWCKILVKGIFGGFGVMLVWGAVKESSLPNRLLARLLFDKKIYEEWLRLAKLYDSKQYDKID